MGDHSHAGDDAGDVAAPDVVETKVTVSALATLAASVVLALVNAA